MATRKTTTSPDADAGHPPASGDVMARLHMIDSAFGTSRERTFPAAAEPDFGVLQSALRDQDPQVRADAAHHLGLKGDVAAASALRGALADPDGEVRTSAAVALIQIGDDALFPEVVKSLRHEDPRVVIGAAVVLGRLADARVLPNLVEAFKTQNVEVGAAVAWALGQCGDPAVLPWLLTAVEQGFAVANACEALGRIGDVKAAPALLGSLESGSAEIRAYAARALGLLHYDDTDASLKVQALASLRECVKDRSRKVRLCSAIAIYELGDRAAGQSAVAEQLS